MPKFASDGLQRTLDAEHSRAGFRRETDRADKRKGSLRPGAILNLKLRYCVMPAAGCSAARAGIKVGPLAKKL